MFVKSLVLGVTTFLALTSAIHAEEWRCPSPETLQSRSTHVGFTIVPGNFVKATLISDGPNAFTFTCNYESAVLSNPIASSDCYYVTTSKGFSTCEEYPCIITCQE